MIGSRLPAKHACGVLSGALVFAMSGAALADSQQVWEGFATVTASTTQCAGTGGTGTGDTFVSIYRPKIKAADTATFLSMQFLRSGITFENDSEATVPQMRGSGNLTGSAINSRAKAYSYTGTYNLTITPASITLTTPSVRINGTVTNWFDVIGCNVTFKATYVKRID